MDSENISMPEEAKTETSHDALLSKCEDAGSVASLIKDVRQQKRLTQKELAEMAGITAVQLCRIENGECRPSKQTLKKLSSYIGIPLSELLLEAGYNNMKGDGGFYKRDGNKLEVEKLVESIYRVDSDLLDYFRDFELFGTKENVEVIRVLLVAMRQESGIDLTSSEKNSVIGEFFRNTLLALKRFIISTLSPMIKQPDCARIPYKNS